MNQQPDKFTNEDLEAKKKWILDKLKKKNADQIGKIY